jgi:DhnA family fructose-bisphosphate aldolase class Ia
MMRATAAQQPDIGTPAAFGRSTRIARLFGRGSGRALVVAWAHGPLIGPAPGVRSADIRSLGDVVADADGILASPSMMPGMRGALSRRDAPVLFMLQHWQSISRPGSLLGYPEGGGATAPLLSVEDAARWGADGVMTYLYVGWEDAQREAREVGYVAKVSERCRGLGLLHMVESRALREENGPNGLARADLVAYHARLAAELGADLVKTKWPGADAVHDVLEGCPVPVLFAGGARDESREVALGEAREMIESGAAGLVWGRKIYQDPDPAETLEQLLEVVHGGEPRS